MKTMKLPGEVARKAEKAREAMAAMQAPRTTDDTSTTESAPEGVEEAVLTVTTPTAPPLAPAQAAPAQALSTAEKIDETDWEHRYKMMRAGRDERRAELEAELAEANRALEASRRTAPVAPSVEPEPEFTLDAKTREYLGKEEADAIERAARHSADRVAKLEADAEARAKAQSDAFYDALSDVAPQWERLNDDPGFLAWLGAEDPDSGVVRRTAVQRFVRDRSVAPLATVISQYLAFESTARGASSPKPASPVSPEPATNRSAPQGDLEQMVEVWSPQEIKDFYSEKHRLTRLGKMHGEQKADIEAREAVIQKAMHEGRVSN